MPNALDRANRPNLLVVCTWFPVLSETFVIDHVTGMVCEGWDVTVVARKIDQEEARKVQAREGVHFDLVELPDWRATTGWQRLGTAYRALQLILGKMPSQAFNRAAWMCAMRAVGMKRTIEEHNPDAIHAHFGPNGVTAALASELPLIVNFHGHDFTSWPKRWGWRLYREAFGRAVVVAHSDFAERRLDESGVGNVKRVTLGVDLLRFRSAQREQHWPRPLRLLSVGRLVRQKGHDVALHALAILRASRPGLDVRLRIIGAGPEQAKLGDLAERLAIRDWVEGPAAMDNEEMPTVYNSADLLVVASQSTPDGWEEAFCRAAVEGMACGLPVVASPCGGLPDTVGSGGIVARAQDAKALAAAVEHIVDSDGPEYWARRARESASRFSTEITRQEYSACTKALLAGSRATHRNFEQGSLRAL
jgi:colanic acid/amylovoran biosynthesis glycosyltransferase